MAKAKKGAAAAEPAKAERCKWDPAYCAKVEALGAAGQERTRDQARARHLSLLLAGLGQKASRVRRGGRGGCRRCGGLVDRRWPQGR